MSDLSGNNNRQNYPSRSFLKKVFVLKIGCSKRKLFCNVLVVPQYNNYPTLVFEILEKNLVQRFSFSKVVEVPGLQPATFLENGLPGRFFSSCFAASVRLSEHLLYVLTPDLKEHCSPVSS